MVKVTKAAADIYGKIRQSTIAYSEKSYAEEVAGAYRQTFPKQEFAVVPDGKGFKVVLA